MSAADRTEGAPLLIVAATAHELGPLLAALTPPRRVPAGAWPATRTGELAGRPVVLAETGIGMAGAAAAVGVLAERHAPAACLCVGIAGAYPGPDGAPRVPLEAAVAASEDVLLDAGVVGAEGIRSLRTVPLPLIPGEPPTFDRLATDPAWTEALARASGRPAVGFATSDGLSGDAAVAAARAARAGASIESMEGAAVALACRRLELPFAQLRGVSNVAGVRDKAAWRIEAATAAASEALLRALEHGPG